MIKFICLFALVSVALASTVQLPAESLPVHLRRVREAEGPVVQKDTPEAPVAAGGADDLEGAETFFHKKIYVVPSYGYGGYYGPGYGYGGYGYGGYGYGGYGYGGYGYGGYGYPHYY